MVQTTAEIKKRYFDRVYQAAGYVACACGCGQQIRVMDHYGRKRSFISGHNGRKYRHKTQYKREWNHRNRARRMTYKMQYYRKRKVQLIQLLGGKCSECGTLYNGLNGSMFQFHHRRPEDKLFQLGNQITNRNWSSVVAEAKKCDLLCANCHFLEHAEEY